ncbi:MAG TPA: AzlC family ABC transporter permease [Rubrobacteraceae bacterium]|nr:AzlC family ABC transporter permease [Rubrobacteraceae bacterium]
MDAETRTNARIPRAPDTDGTTKGHESVSETAITFTLAGALAGARRCVPIAVSGFAIGLVFGTLAGQAGLGAVEATLMSALVFSGAAQFVVIGMWAASPPAGAIALATLVVGLRHLLMGAALAPEFSRLPRRKAYTSVFFMADENWALTMGEFRKGRRDAAFLLGGGMLMALSWTTSTLIGSTLGGALEDPSRWGLDFAFTAVFLALIAGMWKGRSDLLPWTVAALVAVAAHHWLPGQWYILLGGLAGSLAGAMRRGA